MSKKIIYTDEFGNKIDINSIEGIHVILNDIFMTCDNENSCLLKLVANTMMWPIPVFSR